MPATLESKAKTRAFARVIGPYLFIIAGVLVMRLGAMSTLLSAFFASPMWAWTLGAFLLLGGLLIIAFHQYWRSAAAIVISLFGWFLGLRGLTLLIAPQLIAQGGAEAMNSPLAVKISFGILSLVGLRLTYVGWIARPASAA